MLAGVQNTVQVYVSGQLIVWCCHITLQREATLIWNELEVMDF